MKKLIYPLLFMIMTSIVMAAQDEIFIHGILRNATTNNLTEGSFNIYINITNTSDGKLVYEQTQNNQFVDDGVYHSIFDSLTNPDWFLASVSFTIKIGNAIFTQKEIVPVPVAHASLVSANSKKLLGFNDYYRTAAQIYSATPHTNLTASAIYSLTPHTNGTGGGGNTTEEIWAAISNNTYTETAPEIYALTPHTNLTAQAIYSLTPHNNLTATASYALTPHTNLTASAIYSLTPHTNGTGGGGNTTEEIWAAISNNTYTETADEIYALTPHTNNTNTFNTSREMQIGVNVSGYFYNISIPCSLIFDDASGGDINYCADATGGGAGAGFFQINADLLVINTTASGGVIKTNFSLGWGNITGRAKGIYAETPHTNLTATAIYALTPHTNLTAVASYALTPHTNLTAVASYALTPHTNLTATAIYSLTPHTNDTLVVNGSDINVGIINSSVNVTIYGSVAYFNSSGDSICGTRYNGSCKIDYCGTSEFRLCK